MVRNIRANADGMEAMGEAWEPLSPDLLRAHVRKKNGAEARRQERKLRDLRCPERGEFELPMAP